jgi:pantoate--beta-alanine ligase
MQRIAERLRALGRTIAFVPTMGYLHEGHALLVRRANAMADVVVVSIFVNPMQFGPKEDLARYPRDFKRDRRICAEAGADIIFHPEAAAIYPEGFQTVIRVAEIEKGLCGDFRPGHFAGVATVVAKLFNIVRPHMAVFGEKDYQQLAVIRRMVADLDMGIRIVGIPTVREKDGLAMSSRNVYLSAEERKTALVLPRALDAAAASFKAGQRKTGILAGVARKMLDGEPGIGVEYVEVRAADLGSTDILKGDGVIAAAIRVGKTRLIDNRILKGGRSA